MVTKACEWIGGVAFALLLAALGGPARAQAGLVKTLDLSATAVEADTCDFNRFFNEVYVVDFNKSPFGTQLHVYDLNFKFLRDVTMQSPGFQAPEGGIRDPVSGDFFFPSFSTNTIRRFTSEGAFVSSFSTGGRATGLTYDSNNKTLWVADCCGATFGRVSQFTLDGQLVSFFDPPTNSSPVGLGFDPVSDTLFITENGDDHVDEYTKQGAFVQQFIGPSPYPGNGLGLGYDPVTGNLYYGGQSPQLLVFNDPNRPTQAAGDGPACLAPTPGQPIVVARGELVQFDLVVGGSPATILGVSEVRAPLDGAGCGPSTSVPLSFGVAVAPLPASGEPAVATLTWTPIFGQEGCHGFVFDVAAGGVQSQCRVDVRVEPLVECHLLVGGAPLDLPLPFSPSDVLAVVPSFVFPVTGPADCPVFAIPDDPALLGFHVYAQVYMDNPEQFPDDRFKFSNALDVVLGVGAASYGKSTGMTLFLEEEPALGGTFDPSFTID